MSSFLPKNLVSTEGDRADEERGGVTQSKRAI
jgi:hypothetical protein